VPLFDGTLTSLPVVRATFVVQPSPSAELAALEPQGTIALLKADVVGELSQAAPVGRLEELPE